MKRYDVYVYNKKDHFHDKYRVIAEDPVDARNVAIQRLIEETGEGLNANEIEEIKKISDN